MNSVADLLSELEPDPWRREAGFSSEIASANAALRAARTDRDAQLILSDWVSRHQPCFFGRIASSRDLLSYCILTESDLNGSDAEIQSKIQESRRRWTREGFEGKKHGFIIVALSESIAEATPSPRLLELACRLCSLYLLREISPDVVYHDEMFLEKPGHEKITWAWPAGVNYFGAQADKRWWHDHRIPGGMAFSVNSVGHMAKSGRIHNLMTTLSKELGLSADDEEWQRSKVDDLGAALVFAMKTIANAADTVSGRATELLSLPVDVPNPVAPARLPDQFDGVDWQQYRGYYHTDVTVPSLYFRPDVARPADAAPLILDFTYLFDSSVGNPDFITMGEGRRVREGGAADYSSVPAKRSRMFGAEVAIASVPRLADALHRT